MSDFAIKVENLSKVYKLYDTPLDRLKESLHPFRGKYHKDFYALRDVNFEVKKGETVGIIGRNGSGKSTLLKLITGVLTPSNGKITVNGKVSALLELGGGFNPEFTGIENIYFNATLMGYTREEIDSKLDEILSFADIGDFVHQPVKIYSSGMFVRLAFAVAINVDPEILIVDEALAVGDESFQRKCFSRIESVRKKGTTVLFVSHSAATIVEFCNKALLVDRGELLLRGTPKAVVSQYHKLIYAPSDKIESICEEIRCNKKLSQGIAEPAVGSEISAQGSKKIIDIEDTENHKKEFFDFNLAPKSTFAYSEKSDYGVKIREPKIITLEGMQVNNLIFDREYLYTYKTNFSKAGFNVRFGMMIKTISGYEFSGSASSTVRDAIDFVEENSIFDVRFRFRCLMHPGVYFMNAGVLGIINGEEVYLDRVIDALMFRVQPEQNLLSTGLVCSVVENMYYEEKA